MLGIGATALIIGAFASSVDCGYGFDQDSIHVSEKEEATLAFHFCVPNDMRNVTWAGFFAHPDGIQFWNSRISEFPVIGPSEVAANQTISFPISFITPGPGQYRLGVTWKGERHTTAGWVETTYEKGGAAILKVISSQEKTVGWGTETLIVLLVIGLIGHRRIVRR